MNTLERAREIIEIERKGLSDLASSIGPEFDKAVELMLETTDPKKNSAGRVVVTGMGKSGLVGRKISSTFSSVGTQSFFVHPAEALHGDMGMINRKDVIVGISNSGESLEILNLLPMIKQFGLKLIVITGKENSTLGRAADINLCTGVKVEACPWDTVPTASTTAVMALGDALAIVMMEKRGFKLEDYAKYHPSGSLGRDYLLFKVADLMHKSSEMPQVDVDTTINNVLKEMTAKKLGIALVCNSSGELKGIITDGDLRRIFQTHKNALDKKAGDVMSKNPKTISEDTLGGAAVKLMEEKKITSLVIVSGNNLPIGVIHLHDLLKAGVV